MHIHIRRKRLISKSDYNLKSALDAPKSILETEKTLKTLSSGQIYLKNKKQKKKHKKPLGWLKKTGFFPTLFLML
jgi:hypothetical protein